MNTKYSCEQEAAFYQENAYAIQQWIKSIEHRADELKEGFSKYKELDVFRNSEYGTWLTSEVYDTYEEYFKRKVGDKTRFGDFGTGVIRDFREYNVTHIHIFGDWKIGDQARLELKQDIDLFTTGENRHFDIDHLICVGKDFLHYKTDDTLPTERWELSEAPTMIELHSLLVRMRNASSWMEEGELLEEELLRNLFSKLILLELAIRYELQDLALRYIGKSYQVRRKLTNVLLVLELYTLLYNRVNGLVEESEAKLTTEEFLKKVVDTLFYFGSMQGHEIALDVFRSKHAKNTMTAKRYRDVILDTWFSIYQQGKLKYRKGPDNGYRIADSFKNGILSIGTESICSYIQGLGEEPEGESHVSALYTMPGLESTMAPGDKYYDSVKRQDRMKLLLQLDSKQRNTYRKYEGELLKLRTDMIACRTPEVQKALINRSVNLGKLINIELEGNTNDIYSILMIGLDDDRMDVTNILADRDFKKERNSMLYGQAITKNNWNY